MIEYIIVNSRKIILKGIGRLFYEKGIPISISIEKLQELDYEISLFHLADELLKHNWKEKTVYNSIREDILDFRLFGIDNKLLQKFCFSAYEIQREMIFEYLFKDDVTLVTEFFNNNFTLPLLYKELQKNMM